MKYFSLSSIYRYLFSYLIGPLVLTFILLPKLALGEQASNSHFRILETYGQNWGSQARTGDKNFIKKLNELCLLDTRNLTNYENIDRINLLNVALQEGGNKEVISTAGNWLLLAMKEPHLFDNAISLLSANWFAPKNGNITEDLKLGHIDFQKKFLSQLISLGDDELDPKTRAELMHKFLKSSDAEIVGTAKEQISHLVKSPEIGSDEVRRRVLSNLHFEQKYMSSAPKDGRKEVKPLYESAALEILDDVYANLSRFIPHDLEPLEEVDLGAKDQEYQKHKKILELFATILQRIKEGKMQASMEYSFVNSL